MATRVQWLFSCATALASLVNALSHFHCPTLGHSRLRQSPTSALNQTPAACFLEATDPGSRRNHGWQRPDSCTLTADIDGCILAREFKPARLDSGLGSDKNSWPLAGGCF